MRFTLRKNGEVCATMRVEFHVGRGELLAGLLDLLYKDQLEDTQVLDPDKLTRKDVWKATHDLLQFEGLGSWWAANETVDEADYGWDTEAIIDRLFPEVTS